MPDYPSAGNNTSLIFETFSVDDSPRFLEVDVMSATA